MNLAQISSSLTFITMITILTGEHIFYSDAPSDFHLPEYIIPVHYHINLIHLSLYETDSIYWKLITMNYEEGSFPFIGICNITFHVLRSTQDITLNSLHPIINDKTILIRSDGKIYHINEYTIEVNIICFGFTDVLTPGLYTLKIQFFGHILKKYAQNFFEYSHTNNKNSMIWLISPTIQSTEDGQLFPCWNEPHLKTTFKVFINCHRNYKVLFNMPIQTYNIIDEKSAWTHFHVTPPMSILQFALVFTNFSRIRINENVSLWCDKCSNQQSIIFEFTKNLIRNITLHLESEFSEINIPKMDHIAIPNFPYDGTSKWGLIFHREADLVFDKQVDPVMRKMEIARLIAPKIAFQWFSNVYLGSISWQSYFWLHDGLAALFAEEAIVKTFNNSEIMDFFIVQNQYDSLHLDSYHINMNPVYNISKNDSIFDFPRSMKVLVVLRMFQNEITKEVFRKNIHTFLQTYMFMSKIKGWYEFWPIYPIYQQPLNYSYDIKNELNSWISYKYYPTVFWEQETSSQGKLFQDNRISHYGIWWIPVTLVPRPFHYDLRTKEWLTFDNPNITVNIVDVNLHVEWFIISFQQAGYYRANYDEKTVFNIAKHLNTKFPFIQNTSIFKKDHVINRAKFIDDAFHLMMEGQFVPYMFWDLTTYLTHVTDYVAWYPMIKIFQYVSTLIPFSVDEVRYIDIKEKCMKLLHKAVEQLGFDEHLMEDDFLKSLRQEFVKWACVFQDQDCWTTAYTKLKGHISDPENSQFMPGWKRWTYCSGLSIGHKYLWFDLIKIWFEKPQSGNNVLLPYFICSGLNENSSSSFLEQYREKGHEIESYNKTYVHIFHSIIKNIPNNHYMFLQIYSQLNDLRPKTMNLLTALGNFVNHVYSEDRLREVSKMNQNFILTY
ncbi:Aminopeptidase N [Cyphomyrmex costatus]|uniref:Aminopeptidase n=1 Tax=Cyphomyrmex costatus TaxID=456900 RepID=A0A195C5F3_9HYME|nr:Aminopeptidase N [Cyphomyrmex costatus]